MTSQHSETDSQLAALQDRAEQLGKNLHADGARHNPVRASFLSELREIVSQASRLSAELHGEDFTAGAGPDETCGCGEAITWYGGTWLHIANPELRGTDDHDAEPDRGYYDPDEDEEEEGND